jgi:hypothetical protein
VTWLGRIAGAVRAGWSASLPFRARLWSLGSPVLASLLPVAAVVFVSGWTQWREPVGDLMPVRESGEAAPQILASLSDSLIGIALAVLVGAGVIVQSRWRPSRLDRVMLATALTTAIGSIYSGYSFQTAIVEQLTSHVLDPSVISDRLESQSWLLLMSTSILFGLSAKVYLAGRSSRSRRL